MTLLNPLGWLLLLGLPILYALSQKNKEVQSMTLPSLDIWKTLYYQALSQQQKKISPSFLLLIQALLVICACLGMLNLYQNKVSADQVFILYDNSLSTHRVEDYTPLKDFIEANKTKAFQVMVVNETISSSEGFLDAHETLDFILDKPKSKKSLNIALLQSTYQQLVGEHKSVYFVSDKNIVDGDHAIVLPINENNMGIRYFGYDVQKRDFVIELENDHENISVVPLELTYNEDLLYSTIFYLEGQERRTVRLKRDEIIKVSTRESILLTVRLAVDDSIVADNKESYVFLDSVGLSLPHKDENLLRIMDLLAYVHYDDQAKGLKNIMEAPSSSVVYEDDFIRAIKEEGLSSKQVFESPFFPLWVEDHLVAFYKKEVDQAQVEGLTKILPRFYTSQKYVKIQVETAHSKALPPPIFFMAFLMLLIVEEEVRRRV